VFSSRALDHFISAEVETWVQFGKTPMRQILNQSWSVIASASESIQEQHRKVWIASLAMANSK